MIIVQYITTEYVIVKYNIKNETKYITFELIIMFVKKYTKYLQKRIS